MPMRAARLFTVYPVSFFGPVFPDTLSIAYFTSTALTTIGAGQIMPLWARQPIDTFSQPWHLPPFFPIPV
jgi:hypothetical protein